MLDERKLKAIELLAEGGKSLEQIADEVGLSVRQFYRWRYEDEEFKAKWQELSENLENLSKGIMLDRLLEIVEEHYKVCKQDDNITAKIKAIADWEDRCLGTATKKMEITDNKDNDNINDDILSEVFDNDNSDN